MYRFQVPVGWELPEDFVPPIGWKPKDYWVSAPDDWLFWKLDESYSRPYVLEVYENKHGSKFINKWRAINLQSGYMTYLRKHKRLEKRIEKAQAKRIILTQKNTPDIYQKLPAEAKVERAIMRVKLLYLSHLLIYRAILDQEYYKWLEGNASYNYDRRMEKEAKSRLSKDISEIKLTPE